MAQGSFGSLKPSIDHGIRVIGLEVQTAYARISPWTPTEGVAGQVSEMPCTKMPVPPASTSREMG